MLYQLYGKRVGYSYNTSKPISRKFCGKLYSCLQIIVAVTVVESRQPSEICKLQYFNFNIDNLKINIFTKTKLDSYMQNEIANPTV